jgi:hypothetical protein
MEEPSIDEIQKTNGKAYIAWVLSHNKKLGGKNRTRKTRRKNNRSK